MLKELNIKPYQRINITLKEGNYTWNEYYVMPKKEFYIFNRGKIYRWRKKKLSYYNDKQRK